MRYSLITICIIALATMTFSLFQLKGQSNTSAPSPVPAQPSAPEAGPVHLEAVPVDESDPLELYHDAIQQQMILSQVPQVGTAPSHSVQVPIAPAPPNPEPPSIPPVPSKPATQPAPVPNDASQEVIKILDQMEKAGDPKVLKNYQADIDMITDDEATGSQARSLGHFYFLNLKQPKLRAEFKKQIVDQRFLTQHKTWVFDGKRAAEINIEWRTREDMPDLTKARSKSMIIRTLVKPGQNINPLALGNSPLPMPIGQKREHVLKMFKVQVIPPAPNVKQKWIELQLIPRSKKANVQFDEARFFIDPIDWMPRQIVIIKKNRSGKRIVSTQTIKLNHAKRNEMSLDQINSLFSTTPPTGDKAKGWTIDDEK